jgi:hypothetical protein
MAAMAAAEARKAKKGSAVAMMAYQLMGAIILRMVKHFYK